MTGPRPNELLRRAGAPYAVQRPRGPIDLHLDGNEGAGPDASLWEALAEPDPELLRRYPEGGALEARLAERFGISADRVLVTAGADDALDRVCRAMLGPDRELILPVPTFEMLHRYPDLVGATTVEVPWFEGSYPLEEVRGRLTPATAVVAVVTPNNPTGQIATAADLRALAKAAPHALVVVDHAYVEFCDEDLTGAALELPNAVVVRSFSKALGLAGLRVGYALGPAEAIGWLRTAGSPYPVSSLSRTLAAARLERLDPEVTAYVERVRVERVLLRDLLEELGAHAPASHANFVLARLAHAHEVQRLLAERGIAVRAFPGRRHLEDALRITCPGEARAFDRLLLALREVFDLCIPEELP